MPRMVRRPRADCDDLGDPCDVAGAYGVPRVTAELRLRLGRSANRKRVALLMAAAGLQGLTRRKAWRRAKSDTVAFAKDLMARSFRPTAPDELWVADIIQHPTREG
jgi:transposase InsO family protein